MSRIANPDLLTAPSFGFSRVSLKKLPSAAIHRSADATHAPQLTRFTIQGGTMNASDGAEMSSCDPCSTSSSGTRKAAASSATNTEEVANEGTQKPVVDTMVSTLLWARLHEVEFLQAKIGELAIVLGRAESLCAEIRASVDSDVSAAVVLASAHLRGDTEVRHPKTFSAYFSAFMSFFRSK